ncbi:MAG: glycerol-3-phosphate dehydrogenase [Rhodospirillales bacterium]|nr:glycerol-3-phosphate dehydrogenase [Rhodospirillales bacterium]
MAEGSLDAPVRHPIDWNDPDFYDLAKIEAELERVFDLCHGCRRCFNLCDSFPRLFDMIDAGPTGEVDGVGKEDYGKVVEACTLCDLCFMTSCPYVPPHEWNIDFPHLMLRHRAAGLKAGKSDFWSKQLTETDRNGRLAGMASGLVNWAGKTGNKTARGMLEKVAGVDAKAHLPQFHGRSFESQARRNPPVVNRDAPAAGRKVALYATCFVNYHNPSTGRAAQAVLAKNGVETKVVYPGCCGMPQFERGDLGRVAGRAKLLAGELGTFIDQGYDVVALTPSCALMLKFEWPLLLPDDVSVAQLSQHTSDITEYVVDIARKEGLAPGLQPLDGGVALHIACHARAQNMGNKANEMMKLVPKTPVTQILRCSGHGGSWGIMKGNFEVALKVGKPAAHQAVTVAKKADEKAAKAGGKASAKTYLSSECPLAGEHLRQAIDALSLDKAPDFVEAPHPIELFARAYGVSY